MGVGVVVPTYREDPVDVARTVAQIPHGMSVVVVVPSMGDPVALAEERAEVIVNAGSTYGEAVITGMSHCCGLGVDAIVVMDVGSHFFDDVRPYLETTMWSWDVLCGMRVTVSGKSWTRRVYTWVANHGCRALTRTKVSDTTNGFRVYRRHVATMLVRSLRTERVPGYAFNMAVAAHPAIARGLYQIKEFPMRYESGASSANRVEALKAAWWLLAGRFGCYRS